MIRWIVDAISPYLLLAVFIAAAIAAMWAVWRDENVRPTGFALFASLVGSNAAHVFLSPMERPAAYTVFEVMIAATAMLARVCGGSVLLIPLVIVSFMSVTSNLVYSLHLAPTVWQTQAWEIWTNVCYVLECILIFWTGMMQRVGLRDRRTDDRNHASVHAGLARKEN